MKKILLVYATLTGYTQLLVEKVHVSLQQVDDGYQYDQANITRVTVDTMKEYDMIVFGASTWDENRNPDAESFFERINPPTQSLAGVRFMLFGVGDRLYPHFCGAIDTIKDLITSHKGTVCGTVLKIDSFMDADPAGMLTQWLKNTLHKELS